MSALVSPLTFESFFKVHSYDFFEAPEVAATLSEEDRLYARVGRIALTFFTLGVAPAICWLKWEDFQVKSLYHPALSPSQEAVYRIKRLTTNRFLSYFMKETVLIDLLNNFSKEELEIVLKTAFEELLAEGKDQELASIFDRLASLIPLDKLGKEDQNAKALLEEAQKQFKDAKHYLKGNQKDLSSQLYAHFSDLIDNAVIVIEGITSSLGLKDLFKPAESMIQADFKSQKVMMLLSIFSMLATVVLPLLGATSGAAVIGGVFLGIMALSFIWPWIKPAPSILPANAENWSKEIRGGVSVSKGRKQPREQIASILKKRRHALLIGPSRTGKSLTAKAFAQAVEKGKWPELKGKKVFRINMADIVDQAPSFLGGGNTVLNEISEAMGRHREDIILVFDEIHNACLGMGHIAEKLKPFLDEGGAFPHVIGITTDEEYREYVKPHHAFSQRFDTVKIQSTGRKETIRILAEVALKHPEKPIIELSALNEIYRLTKNKPQPYYAIHLLQDCINRTDKAALSATQKDIEAVDQEIKAIEWERAACHGKQYQNNHIEGFKERKTELLRQLEVEEKKKEHLFAMKKAYDQVIKKSYQHLLNLSSYEEDSLKRFWLLKEWLAPSLIKKLKDSDSQGVSLVINRELVREVAKDEEEQGDHA